MAGDNIHAIVGDEVTEVGIIQGGHVTLGKGIKGIAALKKAEMGLSADTTVAEYELPTRIDFLTAEPPVVGSIAAGAMSITEIHVPNGALDAYANHAQWGKAAYIVEEGGKTIDNYAAKHKVRMNQLRKEREEQLAIATERAKQQKIGEMGAILHKTLGPQKLAKWTFTQSVYSWATVFRVQINLHYS